MVDSDGDWAKNLPSVIIVNAQMGENIGASARAMKNCGLRTLHLVNPRDGWPNPAAEAMAAGGVDILKSAEVFETTAEAAKPYTMIAATTARKRGVAKDVLSPHEAARQLYEHEVAGGKSALLFGGERSGLDNDDIARADVIITIPMNPQFSSLNLAQAVLLMGWECRMAGLNYAGEDAIAAESLEPPASLAEKQFFFETLESMLKDGGFFGNEDMQGAVMRNIMAMFSRARLTEQEVRTLHGILKAVRNSNSPDEST